MATVRAWIRSSAGPRCIPASISAPLSGYPASATAGGTVITAEYTGGYGNMVEVDHGNGITTRYGHLSQIDVTVGQVVAKDAIVGRAGSTGRSTGPHLHYEVRIDGAADRPPLHQSWQRDRAAAIAAASAIMTPRLGRDDSLSGPG